MRLPVDFILDVAHGAADERILLLMLPGAKNTPQQLVEYGFIRALRERQLPVDVLALHAHVDLYLDRADIECVLHDTLDEVRAQGYRRIWLLGISLGGSGAMICATQRASEIEGVFLLAPFLGTRGHIAEAEVAGGLRQWRAGEISPRDHERALLERIQGSPFGAAGFPQVYLGYGSEDRYRGASILLSQYLPPQRVSVLPGGHDWETWSALWQRQLGMRPLSQ
ncbi:MAG: alpha/beta hydrolase [Pseudomonadota bacterium]